MYAFTKKREGFNEKVSHGTLFFVFLPLILKNHSHEQ